MGPDTETADDCVEVPVTLIDKTLVDVTANGDGTFTATYALDVTRFGDGPEYDLHDELQFGDAVDVASAEVTDAPTVATVNPGFDGLSDTLIAAAVAIADGETHTYTVVVVASTDEAEMTFESSDCSLAGGESGTGLRNTASATSNDVTTSDVECAELPAIDVSKEVVAEPVDGGDGRVAVTYRITVANRGAGAGAYDLYDELDLAPSAVIESVAVANVEPGTIAVDPAWDGRTATAIVTGQAIDGGTADGPEVHTYDVTVVVDVSNGVSTEEATCSTGANGLATGLGNTATIVVNGEETEDEVCADIPLRDQLEIVKVVDLARAGVGDTVTYTVTITNVGTAHFTDERPAHVEDDMTDVLDDAEYLGDARAARGSVRYAAPVLSWDGALDVGESVTLTYSVRITGDGDGRLDNTVAAPSSNCGAGAPAPLARLTSFATSLVGGSTTCRTTTEVLAQAVPSPITSDPIPVTG